MGKPDIDFIEGPPPTELVITDLIVGEGAEAVPGGRVEVHYVGVDFETGEQFDASWGARWSPACGNSREFRCTR